MTSTRSRNRKDLPNESWHPGKTTAHIHTIIYSRTIFYCYGKAAGCVLLGFLHSFVVPKGIRGLGVYKVLATEDPKLTMGSCRQGAQTANPHAQSPARIM